MIFLGLNDLKMKFPNLKNYENSSSVKNIQKMQKLK